MFAPAPGTITRDRKGSLALGEGRDFEYDVVFPCVLSHPKAERPGRRHLRDADVVDFHRFDSLLEVGRMSLNVDDVSHAKGAGFDGDDGDGQMRVVVETTPTRSSPGPAAGSGGLAGWGGG